MPITPSASRTPTPTPLLPLPHPLSFPQPRISTLARTVLTKIKVEPVNLEPLLPSKKKENAPRGQNDQQLPTPPPAQMPDTIPDGTWDRDRESDYTSIHTAKTIVLDNVQPLSLDPQVHSQVHPRQEFAKEEDMIERGRNREPRPSRFRAHERTRQRMTPYDSESRPRGTSKNAQAQATDSTYARKTNLTDIAAAAAALVVDRATPQSIPSLGSLSSHLIPTTIPLNSSSPMLPMVTPQRQGILGPVSTPPHHHHHDHIQATQHQNDHLHLKGVNDFSRAIHDAVDGMIKLCSCESQTQMEHEPEEMQLHLSSERQKCRKLYTDIQRERGVLALLNLEVQWDQGRLQRERQKLRGQVEKEIFAEKQELKARIARLEEILNDLPTRGV